MTFLELLPVIPFILLLLSIAALPFIHQKWWMNNYGKVSLMLAFFVAVYYILFKKTPSPILHALQEYFSFICLLFSLYVVSGGIFIQLRGRSSPIENVLLLTVGAVISNLFGTTGASMLLIRPFIQFNKARLKPYHIIFFIFIVSNVGGSLTPIGDPPLFIGYLRGIEFFWTFYNMLPVWLITIAYLLLVFYLIDRYNYSKIQPESREEMEDIPDKSKINGSFNFIFLTVIIGSVFISEPLFIREVIMLFAAFASYKLTSKAIHKRNLFNFHPIEEVIYLFIGIFITMVPALELLSSKASQMGINSPGQFYWLTGILTSFLDNAPTYLNFLTASMSLQGLSIDSQSDVSSFAIIASQFLQAISVSAVFFGAMTYIGNGPNFMVKSIAEDKKIEMPSFFGYMFKYSLPVLLPFYFLIWFFLFR